MARRVTAEIASSLGMKRPSGLLIDSVTTGGPAAKAGIQQGDVLMSLGDRDISDTPSLRARLGTLKAGSDVPAAIFRNGELATLTLTPIAAPETPPRDKTLLQGREPLAGATIENLSPAVTEEMGLVNQGTGVIVAAVAEGSNAANIGLKIGDVILAVNAAKTDSVIDLSKVIGAREQQKPGQPQQWHLTLRRGDQILNVTLQG